MRYKRSIGLLLASLIPACGGSGGGSGGPDAGGGGLCVDPGDVELPQGLYGSPADFDRSACTPGALAGVDPSGFWFMEADPQPKFSAGPVRIALDCKTGVSATVASVAEPVSMPVAMLDDDDLFFRRQAEYSWGSYIQAYDLCGVDGDGNLIGRGVRCYSGDFGDQCSEQAITVKPFGRLPGEGDADGLELVSEYNGPADAPWPDDFTANVAIHGDVAYVARGGDAVRIVDVSDPAHPSELSSYPAQSDNFNDLAVVEAAGKVYLLVASQVFGIITLDVTDPANPVEVNRFTIPNGSGVHRLFVDHTSAPLRAFLADGASPTMAVYDVTDPTTPTLITTWDAPDPNFGVHAVFAKGSRAYVNATVGGMFVVDLDASGGPAEVGHYIGPDPYSHASMPATFGGRKVVLHSDEGFDAHIEILDDDPASQSYMTKIGDFQLRREVSVHNYRIIGNTAYVAHYQDGVRLLDLSDPTKPTQIAYYNSWNPDTAPGALLEGAVQPRGLRRPDLPGRHPARPADPPPQMIAPTSLRSS